MKKLSFIALLIMTVCLTSCNGLGGNDTQIDQSLIVGKWMTADKMYFEVYNSDGTGKYWDLNDDVQESEAQTFTWEFDEEKDDRFFQYHEGFSGSIVPQACKILELTSTSFKYNNEGLRATYNLIRAN